MTVWILGESKLLGRRFRREFVDLTEQNIDNHKKTDSNKLLLHSNVNANRTSCTLIDKLMKWKNILVIIVFLILGVIVFRNAILGFVTKNQEKEIFTYETTDFTIELKRNLEKGCVKSGLFFMGDSVSICNNNLVDLIYNIASKNINSTKFLGHKRELKKRYNFSYYPKDSAGYYKLHHAEILAILGKELNFTFWYDTIESIVYHPEIVDYEKLKVYVVPEDLGRWNLTDHYIRFKGNSLDGIFSAFNYKIKGLIIESNIKDSLAYSFIIPSIKEDEIISYLSDKIGIEFSKEKSTIELLTIKFD